MDLKRLDGIPLKQVFDLGLPTCSQLHHFALRQCLACELQYLLSQLTSTTTTRIILHLLRVKW